MSMFMAQHHHPYAYAVAAPPPPPRQYSNHGTSSAFSSSANPDEDWTKISDLAERRRIQNRIAQRNYRKKLKRRLEDLERRAGSSDEGENDKPTTNTRGSSPIKTAGVTKRTSPKAIKATTQPTVQKNMIHGQFTPPMESTDELGFSSAFSDRERSHTPPMFTYANYPAPDELLVNQYSHSQAYPTVSASMTTAESYPTYMAASTVPLTLPSMSHFSDAVKRESYPSDESMNPYMNFGFVSGVNVPSPYDQSNPHTPPLSHTFDHSATCSEAGFDYPTTPPLSMPGSPGIIHQ